MDYWLPESTLEIHSNGLLAARIDSRDSLQWIIGCQNRLWGFTPMDYWLPESTLEIHSNGFLAAKMNCKASRPESVWDAHPIGLLAIK
jgi:hypothetical protein